MIKNENIFLSMKLRNEKYSYQERKNDFNIQIEENILRKRKNKLNEGIMNKRFPEIQIIDLKEIVRQIHNEQNILLGLTNLKNFIQTNLLNKKEITFILENIYYRIVDILFEKNTKYISECLIIINELIKQTKEFLFPLTENLFLEKFQEIINKNKNDNFFMNQIIIFLPELLSIRKDYFIINKKISIFKIIIEEINQEIFRINLNNFLKLVYYFLVSFPNNYLNKLSKICDWIVNIFLHISEIERNSYKNYFYKIMVCFSKKIEYIDIFINKGVINIIMSLISKMDNINDELYLLSFFLDGTIEQKIKILGLKNRDNNFIPFIKELEEIKYNNKNNVYFFSCISSFIHNNHIYTEKFLNSQKFLNILFINFNKFTSKSIKNEILLMTIYLFENNKELCYKKLNEINFLIILVKYLKRILNSSLKKEINEFIICNILEIISIYLQYESNNYEIIESKISLDIYDFENILNKLISNDNNEFINNISRNLYIKYYNQNENYFQSSNNLDMPMD